jgi:putative transposase
MVKSHIIKLYPTRSQEILLKKSCGVARYSYNWALAKWKELYTKGEKPGAYSLIKLQNSIKKKEMPFFLEVSKTAPQYAIHHLERAFKSMWRGDGKYPKFKKKGVKDSFIAVENWQAFNQSNFKIHIPRIGKIKCAENLRFYGKVNYVAVKRVADMWFAVVSVNIADIPVDKLVVGENQAIVGIDMGINAMMILSDGKVYHNPKALRSNLKSLKRLHRGLTRKNAGSSNSMKQRVRLSRKYYRVSNIRKNAIHQATSEIVKKYDTIIIETLRPRNMIKNHKLSQAIIDVSFGEITRQLTYKTEWAGKILIKADQWFASSKTCSGCGNKKEFLSTNERVFKCKNCGLEIDRDLNAAKNLAQYRPTEKSSESEACGEGSSVVVIQHSPAENQEIQILSSNIVQYCTN